MLFSFFLKNPKYSSSCLGYVISVSVIGLKATRDHAQIPFMALPIINICPYLVPILEIGMIVFNKC